MENSISSDLIRGHIDTIILHSLLTEDKFAQKISDTVEEKSDKKYKINQATLYSSLKRLETLKLVKSYWYDSPDGRRKYFAITDNGKQFVEQNLQNWSYSRQIIDKLMDCEPEPIVKTQYVTVKAEPVIQNPPQNTTIIQDKTVIIEEKTEIKPVAQQTSDVDYKTLLGNLLKSPIKQIQVSTSLKAELKETVSQHKVGLGFIS